MPKQNKLNKEVQKRLDKIIAKAIEHEAIKFADSNITLNALRSGTGGYTGEPFDIGLKKILEPFLSSELIKQKEEFFDYLHTMEVISEAFKEVQVSEALSKQKEDIKKKIGFLRQYLNERTSKKLITNEEIAFIYYHLMFYSYSKRSKPDY